jgi:hypothetical protein
MPWTRRLIPGNRNLRESKLNGPTEEERDTMLIRTSPERLKEKQDQMRAVPGKSPVRMVNPLDAHSIEARQATRTASGTGVLGETLYTLDEIAKHLKISKETARRIFAGESGVLALNSLGHRSTINGRVRIRVPQSVFDRVINGMVKI